MLRLEDIGELAYGGLVTGMTQWDKRRIEDGRIEARELLKKASFYSYLVPGLICTGATAFGWLRRWDAWNERIAHGFIYGFPGFVMELVNAFGGGGVGASVAVREAERVLARKATTGARRPIGQTTKPGFEDVNIY